MTVTAWPSRWRKPADENPVAPRPSTTQRPPADVAAIGEVLVAWVLMVSASPDFERGEGGQDQNHRDNPEADYHPWFRPSLQLEVMV